MGNLKRFCGGWNVNVYWGFMYYLFLFLDIDKVFVFKGN